MSCIYLTSIQTLSSCGPCGTANGFFSVIFPRRVFNTGNNLWNTGINLQLVSKYLYQPIEIGNIFPCWVFETSFNPKKKFINNFKQYTFLPHNTISFFRYHICIEIDSRKGEISATVNGQNLDLLVSRQNISNAPSQLNITLGKWTKNMDCKPTLFVRLETILTCGGQTCN